MRWVALILDSGVRNYRLQFSSCCASYLFCNFDLLYDLAIMS